MSEEHYQITYTATLEEMIETTLAAQARTTTIQRGKGRGQLSMAGYLALAATIIFMLKTDQVSWEAFGVVLPITLIFVGVPVYLLWGLCLGWCVRKGVAKIIAEKRGGDGTVCANEFLAEQLCVKQGGIAIRLAWSDLSEIEDRPDAAML